MIQFRLRCDQNHHFESWFASGDAFDTLKAAGHVGCPVCGSATVEKTLMAPRVATTKGKDGPGLSDPASIAEAKLAEIKRDIEANSEYVGMNFATEARAIHDGDAPDRAIYGQAKPQEAKKLIEDGVPVAPLPFVPKQKAN